MLEFKHIMHSTQATYDAEPEAQMEASLVLDNDIILIQVPTETYSTAMHLLRVIL